MNSQRVYDEMLNLVKLGAAPMELLRVAAHLRSQELESYLKTISKNRILDGVFKDVISPGQAYGSVLCPKLMGTYEIEIATELMTLLEDAGCFLDIGCAEGYYTTGVAVKSEVGQIIGVDINPAALAAAAKSASLNGVGHKCVFFSNLDQAIDNMTSNPLIMIDVEGDELLVMSRLFQKIQKRQFQKVILVIETDYLPNRETNTDLIVTALEKNQFQIDKIVKQDPASRFSNLSKTFTRSFLDQALLAMEGRPNDQCWIIATR